MAVRFHRLASQDYLQARRRYARKSARLADRFERALDSAVQKLAANPLLWPTFEAQYRWILLRRFPYVVYYEFIDETTIHVLAVAHASRRPGYWLKRANKP
jgi:plasmid stabilization system protein ParE